MVDPDRVHERLRRLGEYLEILENVREAGRVALSQDLGHRLKAERALQVAIQICIDIGAQLVGELGLTPANDYRGVFASLRTAEVVDPELGQRLGDAAGLRNVLVHQYLEVDLDELWKALDRLDDLRAFAAAAAKAAEDG